MKDILTGFALGAMLLTVIHQRIDHETRQREIEAAEIPKTTPTPAPMKRPGPPDWMKLESPTSLDRPGQQTAGHTRYRDEYLTPFTSR